MNILFVGDIVGKGGRRAVRTRLRDLQKLHEIDFTIANVENSAGGFGITPPLVEELFSYGIDVMTSGNHIWDKQEVIPLLKREPRLLRPANYPPGVPGHGVYSGNTSRGVPIAVLNLQGRVFMPAIDCPFRAGKTLVAELAGKTPVIIIDFHAEATSEKMALGAYLDGTVTAVLGTHTHVPTADTRVLEGGTAYVTDVGLTGSYESVIGMKRKPAISRFLTGLPSRFEPATQRPQISSVVIDVDEASGKARTIRRLDEPSK
jgi:metallophosphoesterase (TIGR00282 family)